MNLPFTFYSEHGEDRWILENLVVPERGIYIDVGASNGVTGNNTLHFECMGWAGVCIEPDFRHHAALIHNRLATIEKCAIGRRQRNFNLHSDPTLSGFLRKTGERIAIPVESLDTIVSRYGIPRIDLISIDTEGTEIEVWQSLNKAACPVSIAVLEYSTFGLPSQDEKIVNALRADGYKEIHRTAGNIIFVPEGIKS